VDTKPKDVLQSRHGVKLVQKPGCFEILVLGTGSEQRDFGVVDAGEFHVLSVFGSSAGNDKKFLDNSWKKFFEACTGMPFPTKCQIEGCDKMAKHGAHVYVKEYKGHDFYFILPTCHSHNTGRVPPKCVLNEFVRVDGSWLTIEDGDYVKTKCTKLAAVAVKESVKIWQQGVHGLPAHNPHARRLRSAGSQL